MDSPFDVITAFVDGERVDPAALESALATAEGRAYLTDIVALREVVRAPDTATPAIHGRSYSTWRWVAIAAMMLVGVACIMDWTPLRVEGGAVVEGVDWQRL